MKSIITNVIIILAAAAGLTFLLQKGGEAGASKVKQLGAPPEIHLVDATPIRPLTVEGRLYDDKKPIALKPFREWGSGLKYGFMLVVSGNPKLNQPSARVVFAYPTAAPIILEIQYTVAENALNMIEANPAAKKRFDGVAVQVSSEGGSYKNTTLLKVEPERPDHRKWLSFDLPLPTATTQIDFWIAGIPPDYQVFADSCIISLPQLRTPRPPADSRVETAPADTVKH